VVLKLSAEHLQAIAAHAERTYPEECCGLMLGKVTTEGKLLTEVRAIANTWSSEAMADFATELPLNKTHRYWIAPEDLLREMKNARANALEIIGVYHSHPNHPAVPSECDRTYAWSEYSYIIVSVQQGKSVDIQSWSLDEQQHFQPEEILIHPPSVLHSG
jgi:proteasome lid subunit RPN8/RPN11